MTAIAILEPKTLLGQEVRESLERISPAPDEIRLLSRDADAAGTITEIGDAAALIVTWQKGCLNGIDLVLACGEPGDEEVFVPEMPAGATLILVGAALPVEKAEPLVAGVGTMPVLNGGVWASPHPVVVLLAHLLGPLVKLGLVEASAHVVLPASLVSREAMDEILEQVRAILSFSGQRPEEVYGTQIAFNLLPSAAPVGLLIDQLRRVLGTRDDEGTPRLALRLSQAGIFHCLTAQLQIRLSERLEKGQLEEALAAHPPIAVAGEPEYLGPVSVAGQDEILIGQLEAADASGESWWLTAVMDNLTRGGAINALALAESLI